MLFLVELNFLSSVFDEDQSNKLEKQIKTQISITIKNKQ